MNKPLEVNREHECDPLEKYHKILRKDTIAIQKFSDNKWYWVRYSDKRGNTMDGIKYCPYCGEELR